MTEQFEEQLHQDLHQYLQSMKEIDARLPECPDVEEKWEQIAKAYIPDGIREFNDFPSASLGWMMYIGMAVAKFWDAEWEIYSKIEDLYAYMRDKRGYDSMDEYIIGETGRRMCLSCLQCAPSSEHRTRNQRGFQCLRFLPAPALPVWSRYAVEQDGLSHD